MGQVLTRARHALRNATRDAAIAELVQAEERRLDRRAVRSARRSGGRVHQCGGCRRMLRAVNQLCNCGFHNDIRGHRNRGGYA